jgi:hypothetical protein
MTDDLEHTTIEPPEPSESYAPYEPAAEAAPASVVVGPEARTQGSRSRWAIALGVVAVVAIATAYAISLFTGRAANAIVLGYVPGDSIMYGEVRMDLPGDQRMALGQFLSRFPGFADQSAIEGKVDEVLDRLVGSATDGDQAFSSDIKPWFGGELAFSLGALPDPSAVSGSDPAALGDVRCLFLVSVKEATAAKAWIDSVVAESGTTTSSESYGGATLTLLSTEGGQQAAYAILDGKVAVIGDVASVKAAVDTKGAGTFGQTADLKSALDATSGDHVGFAYIALRPVLEWATRIGGAEVAGLPTGAMTDLIPDWGAFALRIEGDGLVLEGLGAKPPSMDLGEARTSTVADHVPGNAIALAISDDYGKGILNTLELYRSDPSLKSTFDSVDQAMGFLGGSDAAIGWIGDLGVAVTRTGDGVEGGVLIAPTDRAAAERLFTSIRTLASLGGSTMGISVRDEVYAGTTITIVDLGDLTSLAGQAGLSPEMLGAEPLPTGHVELAYAITDQVVVLGSGPGFVKSVLDTTTATSIAANDRYKTLVARVGQGAGIGFLDVTAVRELIESHLVDADASERAEYETEIKPFLVPFDALVSSSSVKDDIYHSRLIVTVK